MHALSLISTVEPVVADLLSLSLPGDEALVIRADLDPRAGEDGAVVLSSPPLGGDDPGASITVERPQDCWTCSLREVLLAVAEDRARLDPDGSTVVVLPPTVELVHLVPRLADELVEQCGTAVRLAGTVHALSADTAADRLLRHHPIAEEGGLPGDTRCAGEAHAVGLGYADAVLLLGDDATGRDLVEHLRPRDSLLLEGLDAPVLATALGIHHDPAAAIARIHPATTEAWGGPTAHGVRTLDLSSDRPFHPGRLRELVAELAGTGTVARGCFWLPSRPGRVCAWEVAGGEVSVGDAGAWEGDPRCHLVITGLADDAACERIRSAFARILVRPEEMPEALAWAGAPDGLEDWFGAE